MRPDSDPVIHTWDTQLCPETETVEKVGGVQLLLLISAKILGDGSVLVVRC